MLRLTLLSAAFYGVNAVSHVGNGTNGTNQTVMATTVAATTAPMTSAPTTMAATTAAATTKAAVVVASTAAATTQAASEPVKATTKAPSSVPVEPAKTEKPHDHADHCGNDTTSANCTTTAAPIIAKKKVTTTVSVKMDLDLTGFLDTEKKALGNGIAYGIHTSACEGIKDMWTVGKINECLVGKSKITDISFDMAMNIDALLSGGAATACTETDCYGAGPLARRLVATTLSNSGDFAVVIEGAALTDTKDYTAVASQAIKKAREDTSGAFSPAAMRASLTAALNRSAVTGAIDATRLATASTAAQTATVVATAAVVETVTEAPTSTTVGTSSAYTAGAASALALIGGVFLF